jgi:hypothetical protein
LAGGLPFFAAVLSAGGRASAAFCAQSDGVVDTGVFGAGRAGAAVALAKGAAGPADAAGSSVFTGAAAASAFEPVTAGSDFSARRGAAGATGDGAEELPGPRAGPVSVTRTGAPRFGEALAGMIGGGIAARGCAGRGSA